jgi:parvulin-like peptidyl-prolyl isomerase
MACTRLSAFALAAMLSLGVPFGAAAQVQAPGVAARVNGAAIGAERLERSFEEYLRERQLNIGAMRSPQRVKTLKREALDLLIDQELLWQEAQRRGLLATPEQVEQAAAALRAGFSSPEAFASRLRAEGYDEATYATHLRRLLSARGVLEQASAEVSVDDVAIHDFYRRHEADFERPEQRRVRHLVLAPGQGEQAARLRAQLSDGAEFAALARAHSLAASATQGGDIGFVQRDELAAPLAEAAFALGEGQVSAPIELPDGVHLVKVEATVAAQRVPEAAAAERIRAHLLATRSAQAREALLQRLRDAARIEVLVPLPPARASTEDPFSPAQRARRAAAVP